VTGPTDRERLDASVRGRVQGVGFRYFVLVGAIGLTVIIWVLGYLVMGGSR